MAVKNYMEQVVKAELEQHQVDRGSSRAICGCPLCAADVNALSLTSLPPRYCMDYSYGLMARRVLPGMVRSAIQRAFDKVGRRPKHRIGLPDYYPHRIRMVNVPFEEGRAIVATVMGNQAAPCLCPQCQADTLAYALNRFPPLYGVECDGSGQLPAERIDFLRHDLRLVLGQAAKHIAAHPHHT
jgi:hypothetical protein